MRAWAFDRSGRQEASGLSWRELPDPAPGAGELLIRVCAAAVNPADLKVLSGKDGAGVIHGTRKPTQLGYDFSGTVEALGPGASGHAIGDEVFGFLPYARKNQRGSFAEKLVCSASELARKPAGVSHAEAAAIATSGNTALQAMRDKGGLAAGQRALIVGASGGVGMVAVQVARLLGANVSGVASAAKAEQVKALGAERIYDYKTQPIAQIDERFDQVLDVVANTGYGRCKKLLKPGGAFVSLLPSAGVLLGIPLAALSGKRCAFVIVKPRPDDFAQLGRWLEEKKLDAKIERTYPMAELPVALERLRSGAVAGKLALINE